MRKSISAYMTLLQIFGLFVFFKGNVKYREQLSSIFFSLFFRSNHEAKNLLWTAHCRHSLIIRSEMGFLLDLNSPLSFSENGTISIAGPSMKVMYDQQVTFQCVAAGWYPKPTVTWTLNGNAMNSTLDNFTDNGDFFNSTSVLTFQAVRDTTVKCLVSIPALTSPQSTSLFLVVGKKLLLTFCV